MEALPYYEHQVELLTTLVAETPDDIALAVQLGQAFLNLGELRALTGGGSGALAAFERCLKLRAALVAGGNDEPRELTDLAWEEARLAQFGNQPSRRWRRVESLLTKADAAVPLGDFEDELLTVSRIALSGMQR